MRCDALTPRDWLVAQPLRPGERLYAVLGNASAAAPLRHYYQRSPAADALPLWQGTPYARWQAVMPYLAPLSPDDPFLDWIADQSENDWGWLAVSAQPKTLIHTHLRSLTQVWMPDGQATFFRFWDGRHLLPLLQRLGDAFAPVLPVFTRYLIQGHALALPVMDAGPARDFPWWQVPADLLEDLGTANPAPLVDNLLQWLEQEEAPLYFQLPAANLRLKIDRFVRRSTPANARDPQRLKAFLMDEFAQ
ncbi:hypothetical protein SB11R_15555 [Pseudomonas oryzihabitans]|nr:hypothetical protein SB11R_15555 [Pseudomonas psychrotolerans]